jgi:hypothetical protein
MGNCVTEALGFFTKTREEAECRIWSKRAREQESEREEEEEERKGINNRRRERQGPSFSPFLTFGVGNNMECQKARHTASMQPGHLEHRRRLCEDPEGFPQVFCKPDIQPYRIG